MNIHRYNISFAVFLLLGFSFYHIQNQILVSSGGNIALSKAIWLFMAIYFWFIFPALIFFDSTTPNNIKLCYGIFLVNMLARASFELYMMYISKNWHHYFGIGHDIFSIILIACIITKLSKHKLQNLVLFKYLQLILAMLFIEIVFVIYMINYVTSAGHQIFYVPVAAGHSTILAFTSLVNIFIILWQIKYIDKINKL